ncbi:MAG TPA: hypothetical protein VGG14_19535 [Candidatus Sulfotelmatobacter sp.]
MSFVVLSLFPVGAVHESSDAIFKMGHIEVYKQPKGFATEFEVRKELGLMDRGKGLYGLDFHDYQVLDQQVDSISQFQFYSAIDDWQADLGKGAEIRLRKFILQTGGVGAFQQAGPSSV